MVNRGFKGRYIEGTILSYDAVGGAGVILTSEGPCAFHVSSYNSPSEEPPISGGKVDVLMTEKGLLEVYSKLTKERLSVLK